MNLTEGTDFKCVDKTGAPLNFCFGIGAVHGSFQAIQKALNRLSTLHGFAPLAVDGFIGANTVNAIQTILHLGDPNGGPWTKESVAANMPEILELLDGQIQTAIAVGNPLAPEGSPVAPTIQSVMSAGVPSESAADIIVAALQTTPSSPSTARKLLPWILGGLAAVAAIGVGGYFFYRHKAVKQFGWGDDDFDGDDDFGDDDFDGDDSDLEGEEPLQP